MNGTGETVKLLGIFHWVVAALAGLMALFPLLYVGMGVAMLRGAFPPHPSATGPVVGMEPFGWIAIGMGVVFSLGFLAFAALLGFTATCYARHRRWTFCLVVAAVCCAWFPFGTTLGVFSILTLARPETKALFGEGQPVPFGSGTPTGPDARTPFA